MKEEEKCNKDYEHVVPCDNNKLLYFILEK